MTRILSDSSSDSPAATVRGTAVTARRLVSFLTLFGGRKVSVQFPGCLGVGFNDTIMTLFPARHNPVRQSDTIMSAHFPVCQGVCYLVTVMAPRLHGQNPVLLQTRVLGQVKGTGTHHALHTNQ